MTTAADSPAAEIVALRAALSRAEAMIEHLKLQIAKLRRERYGQSSERGARLLEQLELELEELRRRRPRTRAGPRRAPKTPARLSAPSPGASRSGRRCRITCRASGSFCPRPRPVPAAAAMTW